MLNKFEERAKMVQAMEFVARQINDENIFMGWLYNGVADGDIRYGDFTHPAVENDYAGLAWYITDNEFLELMQLFLRLMVRASKSGGLYCGEITTGIEHEALGYPTDEEIELMEIWNKATDHLFRDEKWRADK